MASPFPPALEDPAGFVSLDENSTTACSPLVDMEPSFNVDGNPQLIPTPPPESASSTPKHRSPTATISSSPHHSTSTTNSANEYIKGSSLEESPVSSPSSCLGGCGEGFSGHHVIVNNQCKSKNGTYVQVKEESKLGSVEEEQHGSSISEQAAVGQLGPELSDDEDKDESCSAEALDVDGDADDQSSTAGSPQAQNIPKNVKLPQSKLCMMWHCDYGLWAAPRLN